MSYRSYTNKAEIVITFKSDFMKRKSRVVIHLASGIAIVALWVAAIMWLWNLIVPALTGWGDISYWQALGILVISRLLTGHIGLFSPHKRAEQHRNGRLHRMSEEERKAFIRERLNRLSRQDQSYGA